MDAALPIAIQPVCSGQTSFAAAQKVAAGTWSSVLDHFVPHPRNNYHPHLFSHRMTGLLSLLLISVKIFTISAVTFGPVESAFSSAITAGNIISLTNESRQGFNMKDLTENSKLDQAAQTKANDMLAKGYFAHVTPDGKTPWDFITAAGYNYIAAGENLAVNFTQAENVETAWMNSPGHRANILNGSFQEIGIGISQGEYQGHDAIFVVQMFGTVAEQNITLSDQQTPVQPVAVAPPVVTASAAAGPVSQKITPKQVKSVVKSATATLPAPAEHEQTAQGTLQPLPQLTLADPQVQVTGNAVQISASASAAAVKVIASYGQEGIMLQPKADGTWVGTLNLSDVAAAGKAVMVKAYDVLGNVKIAQAAEFAGSTPSNYNLAPQVKSAHISFSGLSFDPNSFENKFYLLFIATMLSSLIIAIGFKRNIQHLSLVANGSFVVILACLFWVVR